MLELSKERTYLWRKQVRSFIAAIDQGTTSTRCIIFNRDANIISIDQREHQQIYLKPGWVEHNALEIWRNVQDVLHNALLKAELKYSNIDAIGITNQRETTVLWDKSTGVPLHNAIVWQDTRTQEICHQLQKNGGIDRYRSRTGLPLVTYFSGPKIKWLIENVSDVRKALKSGALLFGNMDTWSIWNLTGGTKGGIHITDVTNASRTMLMNLDTLSWDEEILMELEIPVEVLPKILPSSYLYGYAHFENTEIPVSGDLGDQQAALFGQTCFSPGEAKNTYGTGCFMLLNTGIRPVPSKNGLLTTVGFQIQKQKPVYCLEGSIAIAGSLVQWLRDNLKLINQSAEIEKLASSVNDNGGIYFVPAFSGLFAPYWRSDARGVLVGLTSYIKQGHIARAILEATAFQTRDVFDAMEMDSGIKLKSLRVDGGMVKNDLLMQFQSDILNVPVIRSRITETTALGAAFAAGLGIGFWQDLQELVSFWEKDKEWNPLLSEEVRNKNYSHWKKAVIRSLNWID